jgi:hypothetical protein
MAPPTTSEPATTMAPSTTSEPAYRWLHQLSRSLPIDGSINASDNSPPILNSASNSAKTFAAFLPYNVATFRPYDTSDNTPDE